MTAALMEQPEDERCEICGDGPCPILAAILALSNEEIVSQVISLEGAGIESKEVVHTE